MSPINPQEFVSKWKRVTSRERQATQEHFIDLCHLVGHQTPNDYDPTGTRFAFEMGAGKTSGGQGWADVAKIGYFGWEYKGKDRDLDKAYAQLLLYRDALQNPPVLVVSDINHIIIRTNYTNLPTHTFDIALDDLLDPKNIALLKSVFFNPEELKPRETVAEVTQEAARRFAKLAENLRKYGDDPTQVAHFLIRILFCLFAEDIGLLPKQFFPRLLTATRHNSKAFSESLRQLFRAMQSGGMFGVEPILYFNGGLFDDDLVLDLDSDGMAILAGIDALDWSAIEPSIFGTLFERGLDPAKRSQLGAHYTDKSDILLIVEPVLMKPLRDEWQTVAMQARQLARQRDELQKSAFGPAADREFERKRQKLTRPIYDLLFGFSERLSLVRVLDPACGSGNFLYVALRLLLDLEKEVIALANELGIGQFAPKVSPRQIYGIEKNEFAHELAQVTIWIGYIQWMMGNGFGYREPILETLDNIRHMDAILAFDTNGQPVEPEWPAADVILGNPPFLGGSKMRRELGNNYVEKLWSLYNHRIPGGSDLVCYWFEKARAMIEDGQAKRCGFLATNSIRGGSNRKVLERIKDSGDIFWAWSDRDWFLDGAAVNVSMIGFDSGGEKKYLLDNRLVSAINPDLTHSTNITKAFTLAENQKTCFRADEKGGPFDINESTAKIMLSTSANPNGRLNSDVIRPYLNAKDVVQKPSNTWIIDFGCDTSLEIASQYEMPFEYVKKVVKPIRDKSTNHLERNFWWLHRRPAPDMREAIKHLSRYIITPATAKHRIFVFIDSMTIPDHAVYVFARSDDYFLGILHSRPHEIWALKQGTSLEDRPRYTPTTTFETFPFPWPPGKEPQGDPRAQAIAQAARELVEMRDRWLNAEGLSEADRKKRTLTNLYNARPTWLHLAHEKLDAAVFAAYGWPASLADEEILERLLALNLERAKGK